jgi:hypothetical protein
MRKPILLLLPVLWACGDATASGPSVIPDFRANAAALECSAVDLGVEAAMTEMRRASDSTWTLLDESQMVLLTLSDELRLLRRTPLAEAGPAAAPRPVSAVLLGDTAVAVAARGGLRVVILSPDGGPLASMPLDFIPNALVTTPSGALLLTPLPMGARPPTLLMRHTAGAWEPLPVPQRGFEDMSVNAIGNTALAETFPDGTILVMHQMLTARAFLVRPDGRVDPRPTPTPDGNRAAIDFVPRAPITEDQIPRMLVPAMAMSIDPARSQVYVMTKTAARVNDRAERAVLRLSSELEFIEGYTLPMIAQSMIYLPRRDALLVVGDADDFHMCPLPPGGSAL